MAPPGPLQMISLRTAMTCPAICKLASSNFWCTKGCGFGLFVEMKFQAAYRCPMFLSHHIAQENNPSDSGCVCGLAGTIHGTMEISWWVTRCGATPSWLQ